MYNSRFYGMARQTPHRERFAQPRTRMPNPANWEAFAALKPAIAAWIVAKKATFDFAASMETAVLTWGDLTEKQQAAVERCMARDAARVSAPRPAATVLAVQNIRDALTARGKAKIMVCGFQFKLAPMSGANPGAMYVNHNGTYIGKIATDGTFHPGRDFDRETLSLLVEACQDPAGAVRRFAEETARRLALAEAEGRPMTLPCGCCGLTLSDPVSVRRGIGPICAGKWGF